MRDLRKLAKGMDCMIRVPQTCNFDKETTVGCHYRLSSGMGRKPGDLCVAWGCSACHNYVDTHHDTETRLMHAEGVMRTLDALWDMGIFK